MQTFDAKSFLRQAFELYRRINIRNERIKRLIELARKVTSVFKDEPSRTSGNKSLMELAIVEIDAEKNLFEQDIKLFFQVLGDVKRVIAKLDDKDERVILEYRYLAFASWKDIASSLTLSLQHVYRLHETALKKIEKILSTAENETK